MITVPALITSLKHRFENDLLITLCAAFVLGLCAAFGMAPHHTLTALFVGYSGFYILLTSLNAPRHAFWAGWVFAIGYFVSNLNWIGNALLVDGNEFAWVWPLAIFGLPLVLGLFYGIMAYAAHRFLNLKTALGFIGYIALLSFTDLARGHLFTGFPWNMPVHGWALHLPFLQILSITGFYTLNAFTILLISLGGLIVSIPKNDSYKIVIVMSSVALTIGIYIYGSIVLHSNPTQYHEDITVKLVQPNITQSDKWQREKMQDHFQTLIDLSAYKDGDSDATLIIWPETAINPSLLSPTNRKIFADMLEQYSDARILSGMLTYSPETGYGNSVVQIDTDGALSDLYNKTKLVPFGEFIPFQRWIPLTPVTSFQGFTKGSGHSVFETAGKITYTPLICYEIIFPGFPFSFAQKEPADVIINTTNDAWYGESAGPVQHFWHARFRAIENATPVIRVANTGVSAVFDSSGRILTRSQLNEQKTLTTPLPQKTVKPYRFLQILISYILYLVLLFGLFYAYKQKKTLF